MTPSNSTHNPRKRPAATTTPTSGPDRKRARVLSSRTIVAQTSLPELKSGALNVSTFVKSRKFEIAALQKAMASSKAALSQRAFQSLPRDLRRRTASHNAKRVPKRLRNRAVREMAEDNTSTHTFRRRRKSAHDRLRADTAAKLRAMGKKREVVEALVRGVEGEGDGTLGKPPRGHSKYRKRQRGKTWLPTHVWHAKRAHMSVRWRFAVVESPNEKCFRSTQRAVEKRGGVAWDTSYWSSIQVRGEQAAIERVLEAVCEGATADKRVCAGKRSKECWAYQRGGYPTKPIAPVTIIWSPAEVEGSTRRVMVRVHPSAFLQVWEELKAAMRDHDLAAGGQKVFMDDLRFELGSIKITGPATTDALISVLTPINAEGEAEKVWTSLRGLTNPGALPPDVIFSFEVSDPRLRFPPRLPEATATSEGQEKRLFEIQSTWPVPATPLSLLDPRKRTVSVKLQASQKRIYKRKAAALPGQFPEPAPHDPKIPIVILSSPLTGNKAAPNRAPGSWTIILPWKWVQPVWYALMNTTQHIRFGGIVEQRQTAFDHGLPWFPGDFAGTAAGKTWEDEQAAVRKEIWDKKPKQKRLNYDAIKIAGTKGEIGDWDRCDWAVLVQPEQKQENGSMDVDSPTTPSLFAPTPTLDTQSTAPPPPPPTPPKLWWHLPSHLASACLRSYPVLPPSLKGVPAGTLTNAVFNVKITLSHRGAPSDTSRIYRLPRDSNSPWRRLGDAIGNGRGKSKWQKREGGVVEAGHEGYPECPGEEELVGFVTTGNYSLSEGRMLAVGGIVWGSWFRGDGGEKERWCVVRGVGERVGRLGKWEAV